MTIQSVSKKNQKAIEKAYKLIRKYHELVNHEASEKVQESAYNKFADAFNDLPEHERKALNLQHELIHGYGV